MSIVHTATVSWSRGESAFADHRYSRAHVWTFDGGAEVAASSSPHVVRVPLSRPENVDPEEAYVAALSSGSLSSLGIKPPAHPHGTS
jgi:organic hydroperoxide reductase OsmC/OhrA